MKIWIDDIRHAPIQNRKDELYTWCNWTSITFLKVEEVYEKKMV